MFLHISCSCILINYERKPASIILVSFSHRIPPMFSFFRVVLSCHIYDISLFSMHFVLRHSLFWVLTGGIWNDSSYPFNNMLHHHVESIVSSCLESNSQKLIDHLFQDCKFVDKLLAADGHPYAPDIEQHLEVSLWSQLQGYICFSY